MERESKKEGRWKGKGRVAREWGEEDERREEKGS